MMDLKAKDDRMPSYYEDVLKQLDRELEQFSPVDSQIGKEDSFTIISAVITGHSNKIKKMINDKVDINRANHEGWTPLMYALTNGCSEAVTLLMKANADYKVLNFKGTNALGLGGAYGHRGSLRNFCKALAEMKGSITLHEALNTRDAYQKTPLHYAAENSQWQAAQVLIENGADLDVQDAEGNTPLMLAVKTKKDRMTIQQLLKGGADVNVANNKGELPIQVVKPTLRYLFQPDHDQPQEEEEEEEESDSEDDDIV
ncbi:unnamed protein product [Bursaphelenchus okinawaensis]|uniref:ANK_REP_REGION domain-containing protein n=1 Tax=Bursaphelenchus okinawaensis TaxID=465554 RepID=A0A811KNI9_9BILA|nr:unnamed protein product [Bursaphelenchus okinawaensis]CAG9106764.1 unnamed protein product [Bursaphelenchus okinawaensis]